MLGEPPQNRKYEPAEYAKKSLESLKVALERLQKSEAPEARGGFAAGGMPYSEGGEGYVPGVVNAPQYTLPLPDAPSGAVKDSTMSDLASLAKIGMMFLKDGGRVGYASGGATEDDLPIGGPLDFLFGNGPETQHPRPGLAADLPIGGPLDALFGNGPETLRRPRPVSASVEIPEGTFAGSKGEPRVLPGVGGLAPQSGPGKAVVEIPPGTFPESNRAPRVLPEPQPKAGLVARRPAPVPTPTPRPDLPSDVAAAPPPPPTAGLAPREIAPTPVSFKSEAPENGGGVAPPQTPTAVLAAVSEVQKGPDGPDWMQRNQNWLMPLLKGIGAATLYPGKDLFGALTYGAMNAADAYQDTQNQMATRDITRAQTASTLNRMGTDGDWMPLADGTRMLRGQYLAIPRDKRPPLAGAQQMAGSLNQMPATAPIKADGTGNLSADAIPNTPPPGKTQFLGDTGRALANNDFNRLQVLSAADIAPEKSISQQAEAGVIAAANAAYNQGGVLNQLTGALLHIPDQGVVAGGPLNQWKSNIVAYSNDFIRTLAPAFGVDPSQYMMTDATDDLGWKAAADKLSGFLKLATAHGADQNSLGALTEAAAMIPTSALSKDQAVKVLASMYVDKQRALDINSYLNEYKSDVAATHPGQGNLYLAQNTLSAFRKDHPDTQYGAAKDAIMKLLTLKKKDGTSLFPDLLTGKIPPQYIDRLAGIPGVSRFVLNQ